MSGLISLRRSAGVFLGDEPLHGLLEKGGVGVVFRAVGPGEFLGLDHGVKGLRGLEAHRLEVEAFEDVEDLQGRDALGVAGEFVHVVAAITGRDRVHPFGMVRGEIGLAQIAAVGLHEGVDLVRDLAVVETVAALFGDDVERMREAGILEYVTLAGRAVGAGEMVRLGPRAGQALERGEGCGPSNTRWFV